MKLKLSKAVVENILSTVINFTEKKDNSQITSHICIEANDGIYFRATDKEFGITYKDNTSQIIEKGKATINGKKFYEIIKALNDDFVDLEIEENIATISQKHSIYKLSTFNADEFPEFDFSDSKKIDIYGFNFINGLKKILPVIDNNNPKYELNGALLKIENNKIELVSTDSKRLALYSIKQENQELLEFIIPKKSISEIRKLFSNEFEVFYDNINLIIKSEFITFWTKLINGKFPDYKRIVPGGFKTKITLNKNNFVNAIKKINIISNEVKLTIDNSKIYFESISNESFEAKTDIDIVSNINNFTFAVNSRFLLDFCNVVDNDEILLCLNDENVPFVLKEKEFQTIIMPLSI